MKNRNENCWLMDNRIVTAVATIRAQRHAPRKVRTRVTSASCSPPTPACGSSNSTRLAAVMSGSAAVEAEDMNVPGDVLPMAMAARPLLLLKSVRHIGLLQGGRARAHPAGKEVLVIGGWIGFAVFGPCCGQNCLPFEQAVVVRLLVLAPLAGFLERLHRAWMNRHHPLLGLSLGGQPSRAGGGILVSIVVFDHRLGDGVDLVGGLGPVSHEDWIGVIPEFDRLVLGNAGAARRDMPEEECTPL